jgi:cyclophilin family peptidyl-prolyl cis-trans isomerase
MSTAKKPRRTATPRVEALEPRYAPADASGTISGVAFVDRVQIGVRNPSEPVLPGATIRLVGTTTQGTAVQITTRTNAQGEFNFTNVLPGTYQVRGLPSNTRTAFNAFVAPITVAGGDTFTRNVGFGGLSPAAVSLRQFLTRPPVNAIPGSVPGTGLAAANYRPNNKPTATGLSTDITLARNSERFFDMAGYFSDPDLSNSIVRFKTNAGDINVELFDKDAARTVANFFNYVTSNRYDNTIFHRLATGFVLQGGGFSFDPNTATFPAIPVGPTVQNEFGASNTLGTIAMAKVGNDPNSATSQFFFNLANNSSNLDTQNGGFTVFGRLVGAADQATVNRLAAFIPRDATPGVDSPFDTVPTTNYTGTDFPNDATLANFARILDVEIIRRDEFLSYAVVSNSNPDLVTITPDPLSPNQYRVVTTGSEGTAEVVIRASDRYGASITRTFTFTVSNSAPSATVTLTPASPNIESEMTATIGVSDPDGDPVEVNVVWDVDGVEVRNVTFTGPGEDQLDLSTLSLAPGAVVTVTVTPNDGTVNGTPVTASRTLIDRAATIDSFEFEQDELGPDDTLTLNITASDPDGDDITFTYVWRYNGEVVQTTENTAALSDSLDLSTLSVTRVSGDLITVEVTPTSNGLQGETVDGAFTVNRKPTTTGLADQFFSGPGDFIYDTVADAFSDPDGDVLTFSATLADDSELPFWLSIDPVSGVLTGNPPVPAEGVLDIKVTASDPFGGSVSSTFALELSNTPDSLNDVPSATASFDKDVVTNEDTLTATVVGFDADGDALLYTYVWTLNGDTIQTLNDTNLTSNTLVLSDFDIEPGDTIEVTITPADPYVNGTPAVISIVVS